MKKITSIILSIILSFTMVACNSANNSADGMTSIEIVQNFDKDSKEVKKLNKENSSLNKEEVLKKVEKGLDAVKSTESTYTVKVERKDPSGGNSDPASEYTVKVKTLYDERGEISEVYNTLQFVGDDKVSGSYVDMKNKKTYIDQGEGMQEYEITEDSDIQVNNESEYRNTIKMMIMAAEYLDFSEDDDNYYLSFTGRNGELLFKIDGLFGLGINLLGLENMDLDIKYTIRKADFALSSVVHNVKQVYEEDNYESEGRFVLDSINKIDTIEETKTFIK